MKLQNKHRTKLFFVYLNKNYLSELIEDSFHFLKSKYDGVNRQVSLF